MNKAVLISIQPKWCELIAKGKKIVEVRKSRPKIDTPFKCYIYCTKAPKGWFWFGSPKLRRDGVVIGEFVCKMITPIAYTMDGLTDVVDCDTACMEPLDFIKYGKGNPLYAWHISSLKIYDKPKALSDFYRFCGDNPKCTGCEWLTADINEYGEIYPTCGSEYEGMKPLYIDRPPQSWCYVEEDTENA